MLTKPQADHVTLGVPGRKTDRRDSRNLAHSVRLHRDGASFSERFVQRDAAGFWSPGA